MSKKKRCHNCKYAGQTFQLSNLTHLHCGHPKNVNPQSQYDTLQVFWDSCSDWKTKLPTEVSNDK